MRCTKKGDGRRKYEVMYHSIMVLYWCWCFYFRILEGSVVLY
jgi:hypothetical protein